MNAIIDLTKVVRVDFGSKINLKLEDRCIFYKLSKSSEECVGCKGYDMHCSAYLTAKECSKRDRRYTI